MKLFWFAKSKLSNELVTVPVTAASPDPTLGFTVTVDVVTGGFSASPLLDTPTPVTEYSHPVL